MGITKSPHEICDAIERYRLMSSKEFAAMKARWFRPERRGADDPEHFCKWLVANSYVTDFVAKIVSGRKSDHLVLNEYRVLDQLTSGPMAGAYLAVDPLDRRVAIEVLAARTAADRGALAAFREGIARAITVQHANVGRIIEMGEAHGLHYVVKDYYEGQALADVLARRGTLPYALAARLMALAFAGLEALHAGNIPAGDLSAECLLLAPLGKDRHQRTVKILHVGARRRLFDDTALGRSISTGEMTVEQVQRAIAMAKGGGLEAAQDIFQLGCLFYQCVTGRAPYSDSELPFPTRSPRPVAQLASDVPDMLAQLIDELVDADPARRPKKAGHVAKALRVFLAAEEQAGEAKAEEEIASPVAPAVTAETAEVAAPDDVDEADEEEEVEAAPRPVRRKKALVASQTPWDQARAWWDENRPEVRDLLFLAGGALGMLALIFLVELVSGLRLTYVAGLATGIAASYFVEMLARWRQKRNVELT